MAYHVLNRGVGRMRLFLNDADYAAWERVIEETLKLAPMRICGFCWMPNHWHMILWPQKDGQLSTFMQRMTNRRTQRWQRSRRRVDHGHLYSLFPASSRAPV
jgi:putative transposase